MGLERQGSLFSARVRVVISRVGRLMSRRFRALFRILLCCSGDERRGSPSVRREGYRSTVSGADLLAFIFVHLHAGRSGVSHD